jgi:hypothetical protein
VFSLFVEYSDLVGDEGWNLIEAFELFQYGFGAVGFAGHGVSLQIAPRLLLQESEKEIDL